MLTKRAIHALGFIALLLSLLFVGCFEDRESSDTYMFLKHRPSFQMFFRAPKGEADRSFIPGTEGYLTPEEELEDEAFVEFVEKHRGYRRSILLPW